MASQNKKIMEMKKKFDKQLKKEKKKEKDYTEMNKKIEVLLKK